MYTTRMLALALFVSWFGFSSDALADLNVVGYGVTGSGGMSIQAPVFGEDLTPLGEEMNFNYDQSADQSSLGTCTMNPISNNRVDAIIEEMPQKEAETHVAIQDYSYSLPSTQNSPLSLPSQAPLSRDGQRDAPPSPVEGQPENPVDQPENPSVPEPATFFTVGLGVAGALRFSRKRRVG